MFGSRVGFSWSADLMALFPFTSNPSWRQAAILDNFAWPYLPTAHSIHLYSAHRAVIFAIAHFLVFHSVWMFLFQWLASAVVSALPVAYAA